MKNLIITAILVSLTFSVTAQEVSEIDYSGGNNHEHYGWTLAIDEEWLAVGSPHTTTDSGEDAGKVVIYRKSGNAWQSFQEIVDADGNAFQNFGFSVDVKGSVLVVGAIGSFEEGPFTGRAHVYEFDGTEWTLSTVLSASDASAADYFGHSVTTNGTSIVIGAIKADGIQSESGAAYVFEKSGDNWVEVEKLEASDGKSQDNFGYDIDINASGVIVVGSPNQTDLVSKSGAAYLFEGSEGNFAEIIKLKASNRTEKDYFGSSVAINGSDVVVGAYLADGFTNNSGAVYYFSVDNGVWNEQQQISYSEGELNDYFGRHLEMADFRLVVGAPKANIDDKLDVGRLFYYENEGGSWRLKQVIDEPESTSHNFFGASVAVSNTDLSVGARMNDSDNRDGGAVYTATLGVVTSNDEIVLDRTLGLINFPNPAQQEVTIRYRLHKPSRVAIEIFDTNGNPIREVLDETIQPPGQKEVNWNLKSYDGSRVAAGLYLYKLSIDGNVFTKKIIVKN